MHGVIPSFTCIHGVVRN